MNYKAYKYRLYPTQTQAELIDKTISAARFVYNKLLEACIQQYEATKKFILNTPASLKPEFDFLTEVDSLALCNSQMNLKSAFRTFFKKQNRFPKFHSKKKDRQSYTTNCTNNSIRIESSGLRLPKLGIVKCVFHRYCYGKIKSATITKTKTGKYFVSILVEDDKPKVVVQNFHNKNLGIDMSFHGDFAVYSDGTITKFPNFYLKALSKLGRLNHKFSRTKPNSKNHEKLRLRIARVSEKISNQLKDWLEKESLRIAKNYDIVSVEDINLQSMAKLNHGKKVLNNGFGLFRTLLERKVKEQLGTFVKIDKWYPSSQICHVCGYRNSITKNLSVINYTCPVCHTEHNRDKNASINIQKYGEIISATEVLTPKKSACGEYCKTCKKSHCDLVQADFNEASKVVVL